MPLRRRPCGSTELNKHIVEFLLHSAESCYLSGGAVRDWVLGKQAKDLDITVPSGAIGLARRLADQTHGAFYVLDEETDAARVVYAAPVALTVDVAALRGPDILSDLRGRDFTVNAMAIDLKECLEPQPGIIDPCGGQRDLQARVLRATSESAFRTDPVRLLRAVRFAAALGLHIEPETERWIQRDAALVIRPSAERVRQELAQIVAALRAADHLCALDRLGLLSHVLPEVTALRGAKQSEPHLYDVLEHTLVTVGQVERISGLSAAELDADEQECLGLFAGELQAHLSQVLAEERSRRTLLKFAALLHDLGKPGTRSVDPDGRIRAFGHERVGADMAMEVLRRLRFSAKEVQLVGLIVQHHMRLGWLLQSRPVTRRAVYRFFRDAGDGSVDVILLALADQRATRGPALERGPWREYLALARDLLDHYFRRRGEVVAPRTLVTGSEVMAALRIPPGPRIGELLEAVREAQAEGLVQTKEEALAYLRSAMGKGNDSRPLVR